MILVSSCSVYISLTASYLECHITELGLRASVVVGLHAGPENQGLILASRKLFSSLLWPHWLWGQLGFLTNSNTGSFIGGWVVEA
jgi:hypothetical protein